MLKKIVLDGLTQDSVSVKVQRYIEQDGECYPIGQLWSRAYVNSERGRQQIVDELPLQQQNAIFAVWGDTPTVSDDAQ